MKYLLIRENKKISSKSKQYYHLSNGKFNSIHNINNFRKGPIIEICKNLK